MSRKRCVYALTSRGGLTVRLIGTVRVSPPPVPVTVTDEVPVAAVAEAASVTTLLLAVVEAGLKVAVTPAGRPLAVNATAPVKLVRAIVIVLVPLAPWTPVRAVGLAGRVGFEAGLTARLIWPVRVGAPPMPVTVTDVVPVAAVAEAASVTTLLLAVVEAGLKDAVTPAGRPLAVNATAPVKFVRAIVIVLVPLAP